MALRKIQDDELLDQITEVFRRFGYEGASLTRLSEATGLQRASLYHRFPGGKEEMARAVLQRVGRFMREHVLEPLTGPGSPEERLHRVATGLHELYRGGSTSCLLDALSLGGRGHPFEEAVADGMTRWIEAMAALSREAGLSPEEARHRGEDALIRIQGALVVGRGLRTTEPFLRMLEELPRVLLPDAGRSTMPAAAD